MSSEISINDSDEAGTKKSGRKSLYFIALVPDPPLRQEVKLLKEEMHRRFAASHALKSPAHITLQMPFRSVEAAEEGLFEVLEGIARREQPFQVQLSGFDCFSPRVLFIKVVDHTRLTGLHSCLKEALIQHLGFPKHKNAFPFHPHMTIATRDLTVLNFHSAWEEFKARPFEATFTAERLFLLKHNGKYWELYADFAFRGNTAP